jgi:clusterin-associated protein 1
MRVSRQIEMSEVEASVQQALETVKMETANTKQLMENVSASEASLDSKIEKKRTELERNQKRLQTLKKVRCVSPSALGVCVHGCMCML